MQILLEFLELADMVMLEKATNLLEFNLSSILNRVHNRDNPVKDFATKTGEDGNVGVQDDIVDKIDEAMKRLQAARTGLGLANKLKDPDQRAMHKSRIMKNLNLLRMIVVHIEQELSKGESKPTSTPLSQREPVGNGQAPEPYMGGTTGMREEVDPKLVKAVNDLKVSHEELKKDPFNKGKPIKSKKAKKNKELSGKKLAVEAVEKEDTYLTEVSRDTLDRYMDKVGGANAINIDKNDPKFAKRKAGGTLAYGKQYGGNNVQAGHKFTNIQVHDLTDVPDESLYDETQTNDDIHDGDVLKVKGGVAVMMQAWPAMVVGHNENLHSLKPGAAERAQAYRKSFEIARSLPSEDDAVAEAYQPAEGHKVHLGFGGKGGAGFKGRVTKVDGDKVHIKNDEGKTYSGPIKYVTPENDKE